MTPTDLAFIGLGIFIGVLLTFIFVVSRMEKDFRDFLGDELRRASDMEQDLINLRKNFLALLEERERKPRVLPGDKWREL